MTMDSTNLYKGERIPVSTNGNSNFEELRDRAKELPLDEKAKLVRELIPSASEFMSSNVTINFGTNTNITNNATNDSILLQSGTSAEELAKQLEPFSQEDLSVLVEAISIRMRQGSEGSGS